VGKGVRGGWLGAGDGEGCLGDGGARGGDKGGTGGDRARTSARTSARATSVAATKLRKPNPKKHVAATPLTIQQQQ
jgi:hypothetical protein